jgi:carbamoyl-phosphate synthase large subunit
MKVTVAVTSAGSAPAVGVIKALRNQEEIDVHLAAFDMNCLSSGFFLSDSRYIVPSPRDKDFISTILDICKHASIEYVFPIIDEELQIFADNRDSFVSNGIKVIVNSAEVVRTAKNKLLSLSLCRDHGILTPEVYSEEQVLQKDFEGFPLIIKPLAGRGSVNTHKVKSLIDFQYFYGQFDEQPVIQEFIEGEEFTIDIVADFSGEILTVVPRKRIEVKAGMSYKGKTVRDETLISYGRKVASTFGVNGPANIQCMAADGKVYFIELNPKYGAGSPLTFNAGVNIPLIHLKLAMGKPIREEELEFKDNLYMLRCWQDIFVAQESLAGWANV